MNTPPPEEESVETQQLSVKEEPVAQEQGESVFFSVSTFINDTGETTTVPASESDGVSETTKELEPKKELDNSSIAATDVGNCLPLTSDAVVASNDEIVVESNDEIQEAAPAEETHDIIKDEFPVTTNDIELPEFPEQVDSEVKSEPAVANSLEELPPALEETISKMNVGEQETSDRFGDICVTLESKELWHQFSAVGTEMIITKAGR